MRIFSLITLFFILLSCNKGTANKTSKSEILVAHPVLNNFETVTFPSKDGLLVTADLYKVKDPKAFLLLCHQAKFSRGEYIEAAKRLNKLGYSCMTIDQRSGNVSRNIINETAKRAIEKGLQTNYLDAKPDIESAIDYAYKLNKNEKIILVGSSYSASLALLLGSTNNSIKAVAAFSPGEYLKGINLATAIKNIDIPIFVTSSKKEITQVNDILKNVKSKKITHFKPTVESIHGSRALWQSTPGNGAVWKSFSRFLTSVKELN